MRNRIHQKNKHFGVLKIYWLNYSNKGAANQSKSICLHSTCILCSPAPKQWLKPMLNSTSSNLMACRSRKKQLLQQHTWNPSMRHPMPSEKAVQCLSSSTFLLPSAKQHHHCQLPWGWLYSQPCPPGTARGPWGQPSSLKQVLTTIKSKTMENSPSIFSSAISCRIGRLNNAS